MLLKSLEPTFIYSLSLYFLYFLFEYLYLDWGSWHLNVYVYIKYKHTYGIFFLESYIFYVSCCKSYILIWMILKVAREFHSWKFLWKIMNIEYEECYLFTPLAITGII